MRIARNFKIMNNNFETTAADIGLTDIGLLLDA
jgi:hypothetical protein